MTTSAFPPAQPLIEAVDVLRKKASTITADDVKRVARQAASITMTVMTFALAVTVILAKKAHQLLKSSIIFFRVLADLLESFDGWIEQLILDNTPAPAPAPIVRPVEAVAEAPTPEPATETPQPARRRTRRPKTTQQGFASTTA